MAGLCCPSVEYQVESLFNKISSMRNGERVGGKRYDVMKFVSVFMICLSNSS